MRYKILIWPLLDESLAVVTTTFDRDAVLENTYQRTTKLKTRGARWDLPDLLRELADQIDAVTE